MREPEAFTDPPFLCSAMRFELVDSIIQQSDTRAVTRKQVSSAEEYLQDHFPGFPVLPGVLMLESMVQAARLVANTRKPGTRFVLGTVRALKYGAIVRPGDAIVVTVELGKFESDVLEFKGSAILHRAGAPLDPQTAPTAVSGRFTLRPVAIA